MKITIETSGGFAALPALSRPRTTDTSTLDAAQALELETLVLASRFFDQAASVGTPARGAADYMTHVITIEDASRVHTVRLTDPITDPALERLVSRLQALARPAKP